MLRALCITALLCLSPAVAPGQAVLPPNLGVPASAPTVPGPGHDLTLVALAVGDYAAALGGAEAEYRGSVKIGADRWIDSIASAAMLGECLWENGRLREALGRYEESLVLSAAHANWLLSVRFPPQPPQPMRGARAATWGRSRRNAQPALIPETMPIRQQGADPQDVLQRGGVLASTYDRTVRPQEILRSLVIALYRTGSLLGELGPENAALDAATRSLSRRPAPPQHYSQAWIDVALGTALWAQGKADQAQPLLTRGLFIGNQLDHPLTAWGLIVLGRMALDADQAPRAVELFEEATYIAADYGDVRALEEAFEFASRAHRMAGTRGVPASIKGAAEWARSGPPVLRAKLLAMQADSLAAAGDLRGAVATLKALDGRLLKGEAGRGMLGAQAAYAASLVAYGGGDVAGGDGELERALMLARPRSLVLFRIGLVIDLLKAGSSAVSDRQADGWFDSWLADPRPREYVLDPLGTLAFMSAPREAAFDAWVVVAGRRGHEQLLEAAEATMRNRWLSDRPLGGRRIAIQRFLDADPRSLEPAEAARWRALIAGRQGLDALLTRSAQVGGCGAAAPPPPAGNVLRDAPAEWQEYAALAATGQAVVAALAAGSEATPPLFPPHTPSPEIRRRLEPNQALLSFHWTATGLFGALEFRDRLVVWQVRQAGGLPAELKTLARALLLSDKAAAVPVDRLAAGDWQGSAARIERMLFENARGVSLAAGIEELVIVPDGWLWYLPFELLPITSNQAGGGDLRLLREVCKVRYAPTRSLAVLRHEPRVAGGTGAVVGRLTRGEKQPEALAAVQRMTAGVADAVVVEVPAAGPPAALVGSLFDTLLIADESATSEPPVAATLLAAGQGRGGLTLADWLAPPAKRPQRVVVPGLQTAMGGGLLKPPARPGQDVFLAVTDLLAAGGRTALVTRWRSAGGVAADLVQEFLRETAGPGGTAPVDAWQRAVDVATAERPDLELEPRIKPADGAEFADARHPIFWAGFLLVDVGGGVYDQPVAGVPPPAPLAPAAPAPPGIAPAAPAPQPAPGGPPPPAILEPPPPRPDP